MGFVAQLGGLSGIRQLGALWASLNIGSRDLYKVFGYKATPGFDEFYNKYLRQDVAARIVDAPAAALWTNPPIVTSNKEAWNTAWDDLVARNNLFPVIEKADKLAGIGRYAILLIGFNDNTDLDKPVNMRNLARKAQKVTFLQQYGENCAKIDSFNLDPRSDDFMKPLLYTIQPVRDASLGWNAGRTGKADTNNALPGTFRVHASRVVHIAENALENDVFGSPRLERVYNVLDDLMKVTGGTSEVFWLTANRGMHVDVDKEMELEKGDEAALSEELDEYSNGLRRFIRTRGVKINSLGSDVPDPTGTFNVLISVLSGATGIPRRILTGSEAGQLASEQDRANWADRIDERRSDFANPYIIFPLIKKLTAAGVLMSEASLAITVQWPSSFKMSPLEAAQTSAQHARSATNFAKAIDTMEKMKRGEPGTPDTTTPDGKVIPGTPAIEGVVFEEELVTIPEARKMIGLDTPKVTFDSGEDVKSASTQAT